MVPPPSSALPGLLDDLFTFLARTDLPSWLMQAVAYYQLIQIHPAADGNGRLARALVAALGARAGSEAAGLTLAAAISLNREGVTRWHAPVRDGDAGGYLAKWQVLQRWIRSHLPLIAERESGLRACLLADLGSESAVNLLLPQLAANPVCSETDLASRSRWSAKNAPGYLERLLRGGWLVRQSGALVCRPVLQARQAIIDELAAGTRPLFRQGLPT